MNAESVSVVIPTYNRAAQIMGAVASVLGQTSPPGEIIVVDDGSTDETEAVLAPVRQQIRYIKTPNRGVSAARNLGIREASGSWVAFLDSDDTWEPDKLKRQCEALTGTSKVCFCVSSDESGTSLDDLQAMDPGLAQGETRHYQPADCRVFFHPGHPFLQSMLVEKETLFRCGLFDESLKVAEDTKLIHALVLGSGYAVVNERLVNICRQRETAGLSDTADAAGAFKRYDCYARVQSEAYWRLVRIDGAAASVVRRNQLYFVSRLAELSCALREKSLAKRYAAAGLAPFDDWKCLCRNLLILLAYPFAQRIFVKKWRTGAPSS